MNQIKRQNSWVPPLEGYFKLNVDGAIFSSFQQHTGIGAVLKDSEGNCIMVAIIHDGVALNPENC